MPVSANTLFHFTSLDTLKKILLSSKFYPSYSEEHFEQIVPKIFESHSVLYVPFASFCDLTIIQLARDSKHTKYYDKYGIGLKKKWGNENEISPVTYVHKKSPPANQIFTLYNLTDKPQKEKSKVGNPNKEDSRADNVNDDLNKLLEDFLLIKHHMTDSFKYLKPYSGHWLKKKKSRRQIIYYNEREWRFSPPMDDFQVVTHSDLIKIAKENNNTLKQELKGMNKSLWNYSAVKFNPDDIKYIIVNKEKEVMQLAKWIRRFKSSFQNILIPKLISFEKIQSDF